ncbi:DUF2071 domain-containing protein [Thalassoglobus sp. JC818]|uniref:YqjF family protein n=1 Tax=Thalassoglobus sp. JC818 TaxID=3232136 RepID=UPI00345A7FF6
MSTIQPSLEQRHALQIRPDDCPVMFQSWRKLLFLHWKIDPELIQQRLPRGLTVDTFDGAAWIGVVPFLMRRIRPSWSPQVPYISNFLELNVRTYAYNEQGIPGVWFFSLTANRWLAVMLARKLFGLPYVWGQMSASVDAAGAVRYRTRQFRDDQRRTMEFEYQPQATASPSKPGTLDFFLVERYILFSETRSNGIATGQVHHPPYEVQPVKVNAFSSLPVELDGFPQMKTPPEHLVFSEGVDVEVFGLKYS